MTIPTREAGHRRVRTVGVACLVLALVACAGGVNAREKPNKDQRMLEEGLSLLDKGTGESICKGAAILGRLGRAEAIEPLLARLRTRDEAARECVRGALSQLDVAPALLAKWRTSDPESKDLALELAVALPHPGLMAMYSEAGADTDPKRRRRVATGLRRQPESLLVMAMLDTLVADPDSDVRWWAIDTLSLSKSDDAARILRARLPLETDVGLRTFIERALGPRK